MSVARVARALAGALLLAAMGDASQAADPKPESTRLVHRGMDYSDAENYQGAVKLFTRAIEIDPGNAQAYNERAFALLGMHRDRDAIADFERALEINPNFPGARRWLAMTVADLGEHRRAAEEWLRHIRNEPNGDSYMGISPTDWARCAEQFALAGDRARAIQLLEEYFAHHAARVTKYSFHETTPMRQLARLYDEAGRAAEAEKLRERARNSQHRVPADL